tara:strand:+ start:254 stop:673 length:420 start_codon:yes stop_codon:yes gene_type:complete
MRVENWDSKLQKVIKETIDKEKFNYGKNDCITFTLKCIETITGKKVFNHKWKSLKDGKAIIKKLKKKDLLDIALHVAKENNFKLININFAQRGDVLYYKDEFDWDGTLGVCIGDKTMFNWKKGISLILNNQCKYCWRIE